MAFKLVGNNIEIKQGDAFSIPLTFEYGTPSIPRDITGYTVYFSVIDPSENNRIVLQKIVTDHTDPTQGKTVVKIHSTDTINLELGNFVWGIQLGIPFVDGVETGNDVSTVFPADPKIFAKFIVITPINTTMIG